MGKRSNWKESARHVWKSVKITRTLLLCNTGYKAISIMILFLVVLKAAWSMKKQPWGRNANSRYYKSMERLFGTKKVKVCLGYYHRNQRGVAAHNVPNALLWVFHNKPLPWQLNLQPHKRNTSNSFFRMTQISHGIKGLVLKILP